MKTPVFFLSVLLIGDLVCAGFVLGADVLQPAPEGCIYFSVIEAADTEQVVRGNDGRITAVISPTQRTELLRKRWSPAEFEAAILEIESRRKTDPIYGANFGIPVGAAWKSLQARIEPEDEIWTFGLLDVGTVVIRKDRVVCLVVTEHQW